MLFSLFSIVYSLFKVILEIISANVSRLEAVGVKEAFTFGLRLNFANTKPTSNYALNPQLLQTAVIWCPFFLFHLAVVIILFAEAIFLIAEVIYLSADWIILNAVEIILNAKKINFIAVAISLFAEQTILSAFSIFLFAVCIFLKVG